MRVKARTRYSFLLVFIAGAFPLVASWITSPVPVPAVQRFPEGIPAEPLEAVLRRVSFPVWIPTWLPFAFEKPFAFLVERPNEVHTLYVHYVNVQSRSFVEVAITNRPVPMISDRYPLEKVRVRGSYEGVFLDNGTAQMLAWDEEGMHIMLTASRPEGPYSPSELLRIAEHLKRIPQGFCLLGFWGLRDSARQRGGLSLLFGPQGEDRKLIVRPGRAPKVPPSPQNPREEGKCVTPIWEGRAVAG